MDLGKSEDNQESLKRAKKTTLAESVDRREGKCDE